jgi:predicted O-methyltransferase YrrM
MTDLTQTLVKALKKPHEIPFHLSREASRFARRRTTHREVKQMICDVLSVSNEKVDKYYTELKMKNDLLDDGPSSGDIISQYRLPNHTVLAYLCCRALKPDVIVETGVHRGKSSALLLEALNENNAGVLHSIDLPGTKADPVVDESSPYGTVSYELADESEIGSYVPNKLKSRWELHLGSSDELLEPLLNDVGQIDLFIHDSDHSYENMIFEFSTAYGYLSPNGCIISDDIDWNTAFSDFAQRNATEWSLLTNRVPKKYIQSEAMAGLASFSDQ